MSLEEIQQHSMTCTKVVNEMLYFFSYIMK